MKSTLLLLILYTIKYDVQPYSKEGDRAIRDVLKRLPGIKTSEDGKISYNGVPINRFYIENSNLLGTQYGIATNNIPQKNVASVEVMQNHTLKNTPSVYYDPSGNMTCRRKIIRTILTCNRI